MGLFSFILLTIITVGLSIYSVFEYRRFTRGRFYIDARRAKVSIVFFLLIPFVVFLLNFDWDYTVSFGDKNEIYLSKQSIFQNEQLTLKLADGSWKINRNGVWTDFNVPAKYAFTYVHSIAFAESGECFVLNEMNGNVQSLRFLNGQWKVEGYYGEWFDVNELIPEREPPHLIHEVCN